ncbi:MAG: DUF4974 domain-containing protein [Odoribacteraceae bacterium]|jgi:ferric-dicitrate binding protein FerR (iron transport regulator)|nr:DUF4974 domain-containing protein [Odoribacteraceae bacterium]
MEDNIYEILARDTCGEHLSLEEEQILAAWRQSSPEHEKIYNAFSGMKTAVRLLREHGGSHAGKSIRRATRAIHRTRLLRKARLLARCAAGILLLAGAFFAIRWSLSSPSPLPTPLLISRETNHALLVLANNRSITLHQAVLDTIVADSFMRIINAGNRLVYDTERQEGEDAGHNRLIVPVGGEYQVQLADGTLAFLNSGTELRYPERFTGTSREVYLEGEAWFEVKADASAPFIVHAGEMEIRALGTDFNVLAREQLTTLQVTLVSGSVEVADDKQRLRIVPGQQAVYDKQERRLVAREVETALYTSWKDGYYTFNRASLEEIMTTLSLWYGIDVHFRDEAVRHMEFTGRLKRYEDAARFLEMLGETRDVQFDIRGNNVTIHAKRTAP